jgi:hypothetical protein
MTPAEKRQAHAQNCEALRISFNVLQGLIKELNGKPFTADTCTTALNLSVTSKHIYERFEREKRALESYDPLDPDCALLLAARSGFAAAEAVRIPPGTSTSTAVAQAVLNSNLNPQKAYQHFYNLSRK